MHRSPPSVLHALHSQCGRAQLPAPWTSAPSAWRASIPASSSASLYGLAGEDADADVKLRRLEAVLLISREPMNSRKASQFAGLADGTEARTLIKKLNRWYDKVGRAFRVEEVAGGFQMRTRPQFAPWVRRLGTAVPEVRLSPPALETLAVVAYRQPVPRADIEAIRGVNSGEILRLLLERDLIRVAGRSEELGRPFLYATTRKFLEVFGLANLDDLPRRNDFNFPPEIPQNTSPPLHNLSITGYTTDTDARHTLKETDVTVTTSADLLSEEKQREELWQQGILPQPRLEDEEDDFDDEDEDDDDDDLDDDEEDDLDDDEDEEDLDDVDEDFDDDWEEVDDEELDEDEEDEEDDLEEDDEDWDDDEEEDEEEDEDWE